jgi:Flp pilus assembly pilin Flp
MQLIKCIFFRMEHFVFITLTMIPYHTRLNLKLKACFEFVNNNAI